MDLTPNYKKAEENSSPNPAETSPVDEKKLDDFFEAELNSVELESKTFVPDAASTPSTNGKNSASHLADEKPAEKDEEKGHTDSVKPFKKDENFILDSTKSTKASIEKLFTDTVRSFKADDSLTAEPSKAAEPTKPAESSKSAEPSKIGESIKSAKPAAEKNSEKTKPLPSLPPNSQANLAPPPHQPEKIVSPVKDLPPSMPAQTVTPFVQQISETLKSSPSSHPTPVARPRVELSPFTPSSEAQSSSQLGDIVNGLLKFMVEKRASDLHLRAGTPIIFRIDGNLMAFDKTILSAEMARDMLFHMLPQRQRKIFEVKNEADFSYAVPHIGRFRGNAFRQRGSVAVVLRQIPTIIPTFSELNLPNVMEKFCKLSRGLVLVCGPTGSGKSTALAAMIQQINADRAEHIVTIEDPIEFLHRDNKAIISQRELGSDTISFSEALKHVLRQDPDVILLGEMRDLETTSTAITAAQTGHLVLSTLHTTDAVQTINRIIDLYPPHQQQQVRYQLADVLKGVVCQRLISHARGVGRIPTCEVLVVTALVKKAIAENKMSEVQEAIRQGQYYGMQSFHQSLLKLYKEGQIKLDEALEAASNPEELMMAIRGITQGTEGT